MHRILTAALILLVSASLPTVALERSDLVPDNAQVEIRISDTTDFLQQLEKSSLGRLWADSQFQEFLGNPEKDMLTELFFGGADTVESEIMMEQFKMLTGEMIVAWSSESDDFYLIVAMSEEDFRRSLVLDDRIAETSERSFDIVRESFQDIDVIQHIDDGGTAVESRSWQAHLNNTLIMGPSREWLEKSILELKKETIEEPEGNPAMDIRIPLAAVIRQSLEEEQNAQATSLFNPADLYESLGLLGIEQFTTHLELKDDEMIIDSNLQATSLGKGIFTLLDMEPAALPDVGFVPDNISLIEVGRLNLLRFWQEIPDFMTTAMPAAKPQLDMLLANVRSQIGIDIETDLLAHLGTRYLSFSALNDDIVETVMALELKDGSAVKNTLETVMGSPMVEPQISALLDTVDFLNYTLYVNKSPEPEDAFAFCVADNYLLYGSPDAVRQVIRSKASDTAANRLEDNALVIGLRQHVPASAFGYSAVDLSKNMETIIRELTKPDQSRMIQEQWARSGSPIPPPDFGKLPPTDHLASFFNTTYLYIEKTNEGLHQKIIVKY